MERPDLHVLDRAGQGHELDLMILEVRDTGSDLAIPAPAPAVHLLIDSQAASVAETDMH